MDERWRVIETWDAEPGFNMGLDEALLLSTDTTPVLRFYTWKPAALSLGYFQRYAQVAEVERAECVVRRLTGGGAIHHGNELTFSLAAPAQHALFAGEVRASYERVHGVLIEALARLGVRAALRGRRALAGDDATSGMCFRRSSDLDLVWDGAKGVGSAQRRRAGRVLHHGSIKLAGTDLEHSIATLHNHVPALEPGRLARVIADTWSTRLGITCVRGSASQRELEHAHARAAFFRSAEHLERR